MTPISIMAGQNIPYEMFIQNTMVGQKGIGCKIRILYEINGIKT